MNFFLDFDRFLSQKQMTISQFIWSVLFVLFSCFAILFSWLEGNYFSIIALFIVGILCLSLSSEIKKLQMKNNIISFQRDMIAGGFDSSFFAFLIFSETGKCIFINRVAQNLFQGFKIKSFNDFVAGFSKYPNIVEAVENLRKSADNLKQSHVDVPMNFGSDHCSLWRISVSPIPDNRGYTSWTIVDLTPSSNRIESLETNSSFLLDIVNKTNMGYVCLNDLNVIVFCNNTFSYLLGIPVHNLLNQSFLNYIDHSVSDPLPMPSDSKILASLPSKIVLKSEVHEKMEVVVSRIFNNEKGLSIFEISRDTQHSTDIVQALGKTKLYFEHIFEDAPVGIAITDGAEIISAGNRTFRNLVGAEEVNETSFLNYVAEEEKEEIRAKLYQLLQASYKSVVPFEIRFRYQNDKTVMLYVSKLDESKRTRDNDGLVMYFIDVTKQKSLQQQFVQSQKMQAVGQLAGGIAHDFNNLLTAMIGYCDLLLEKYLPSDQSFNDIMQIKQNANRASNLVKQLLAFSRQQTLQPRILGVTDMLSELSALLKRLLGAKVELKVVHSRDAGYIKVDQIQFEQVIINLAVNARDAMKEGGVLSIKTQSYVLKETKFLRDDTMPPGKYVLIEVTDTGSGIDAKDLSRIFDPFFSTKEKGHGTGLGLSTVYGIINQTGGFISVRSEVGTGTTFSLYFPMASDQDVAQETAKISAIEKRNTDLTGVGTILLVEDEDAVRMFSSRALRDKGYRVIEASNGESALEFITKDAQTIDLVITDVVMPKMDGPTLIEHIKKFNPKMRIIFISGYTEDSFRNSLAQDSKVHFLPKPFNLKDLAGKVKEVLG
ncbi:MAG: response regulator [Alphaproteobacteria bacterium]|nr:response regulator [Alphaproteobacteria bacterium]